MTIFIIKFRFKIFSCNSHSCCLIDSQFFRSTDCVSTLKLTCDPKLHSVSLKVLSLVKRRLAKSLNLLMIQSLHYKLQRQNRCQQRDQQKRLKSACFSIDLPARVPSRLHFASQSFFLTFVLLLTIDGIKPQRRYLTLFPCKSCLIICFVLSCLMSPALPSVMHELRQY